MPPKYILPRIARPTPEQLDEHLSNIDGATEQVLEIGRLLYAAAFPERPPLTSMDLLPPLYLRQATTLGRDATLRLRLSQQL